MQKLIKPLSASGIKEYLLVLSPHEELWDRITDIKKKFALNYPLCQAWGKPHITLAVFTQHEASESRILNALTSVAMYSAPIKVELKDYGCFPTHTIYINIISRLPIQNLSKRIRSGTQSLMKPDDDNKPHFITEPHLTIARKISAYQFDRAWLEYSHCFFTGRFVADSMLLLKRSLGEKAYKNVCRFPFKNLPGSVKQRELF